MPGGIEEYRESRRRPEALAGRRRDDAGLRSRIESGDMKEATDPNAGMSDAELNIVSGGGGEQPGNGSVDRLLPELPRLGGRDKQLARRQQPRPSGGTAARRGGAAFPAGAPGAIAWRRPG